MLNSSQISALHALGIDPATVAVAEREVPVGPMIDVRRSRLLEPVPFDDAEWGAIAATGALPPDPTQAGKMTVRDYVACVLAVVCSNRQWVDLGPQTAEAVRRRFGRDQTEWQDIAAGLSNVGLSARAKQFAAVAKRAQALPGRRI